VRFSLPLVNIHCGVYTKDVREPKVTGSDLEGQRYRLVHDHFLDFVACLKDGTNHAQVDYGLYSVAVCGFFLV
jgi:hypothetical protein